MENIPLELRSFLALNDRQFAEICAHNKDLKFEKNAQKKLIIISPVGTETGRENSNLSKQL